ncbi:hypothetical protein B9Z51_08565 [Limnohabitans sp. T6-5]|uniref:Rha family transcriptional regulator n=1 Tax=Limnohabitans sp. T6-5 TaxID=1100724 RepID=UPI000D3A47EC|nr:Rha family transcriptional regulator [Limnohabitans sp. T6-5]PUE08977.1 hypothetical protein B9Z51_08565 [Limnohabitans sp. T6-5]
MADAIQGASVANITPTLTVIDGNITTTSLQVSEHFGKRHDLVLRAIRNLECSAEFRLRNFAETVETRENPSGGARIPSPAFSITRDGFVFLAMGFTGKEAAQWKEAYITAFNRMERELIARTTRPVGPTIDYRRIDANMAQTLKEEVARIVATGRQGYGETWARLHRKFRVNSYLELPASQYQAALAYLSAKSGTAVSMPQPSAIDPAELLLSGQSDPVALTAAQQAMVDHRAWELAGHARELIHAHIQRRIAYKTIPDNRTDETVLMLVESTTLGNALTHFYGTQLGNMASILSYMQATAQQTMDRYKTDMGRLGAAGAM